MKTFTYTAQKPDGTIQKTTVDAEDRFAVYEDIRKAGMQMLKVEETKKSSALSGDILSFLKRVKKIELILFLRNTGAMLRAGLALPRAMHVMIRQTKNEKLKAVLSDLLKAIEQGGSLSSGMRSHTEVFTPLIIAMVEAGEESGNLADTLTTIALQIERSHEIQKKVRGAMIYPTIIISALLLVGGIMMVYIVPSLTETFREMGTELPATTQFVIALSDFLVAHTLLVILLLVATIAALVYASRTPLGSRVFEVITLKLPVIGTIIQETNSARTGRTLSSLLSSGVHMVQAIEITQHVIQNSHYRAIIENAKQDVEKGKPLASAFIAAEKLYPPLVGELIAVGEETGALPDMLKEIAKYYENEVEQKTKNMSTIIEPVLMLVVGGGVGFFAIAMISPIYNISIGM
jgi:type IV pilus assembly protein PilC